MKRQNILNSIPKRVNIIGVPISVVTMDSALSFVSNNIDNIRGEYICASNVHTTVMAHDDKEYLEVQSNSIMSLPDGKPLSVVGSKKTKDKMEKVTGTHFMLNIFEKDEFNKYKHYFYGSTKENLEEVIKNVNDKYKNVEIAGYEPSIFRELKDEEVDELAKRINKLKTDFLWVGIGAPRQEKLMYRLKGKVNCVMIGVGGAFNILSGKVNDAPLWMQNAGLEWLYRLIKEPRRLFKRYFVTNTKFILYLFINK